MRRGEHDRRPARNRGVFFCLRLFGVVSTASRAIGLSKEAAGTLRAAGISDDDKELAARQLSIRMLALFGSITARAAGALIVPFVLVLLLDAAGLVPLGDVMAAFESWTVILLGLALTPLMLVRPR